MFPLLPVSLLALVLASPVLSIPHSLNDPFRGIALQAPKPDEHPICCLRPLDPAEPSASDDVFISFEEWKVKRLEEAREQPPGSPSSANNARRPGIASAGKVGTEGPGADSSSSQSASAVQANGQQDSPDMSQHDERLAPHFRIPIVDRFNYASTDCSARVHTAHRSAKSPSSILSSKRDRYMLSPCAEEKQFVVVELCDDIMIDTVQLANYEFFSGVFKDFSVSVAKTPPTDDEGWLHAGTYRARNVRGVQSFHPPATLRDFYRFIRIDFHSHYGNEFYCPLSLLRVYGLTHLEQWKWDEWESQSKAKKAIEDASAVERSLEPPQTAHIPVLELPKANLVETAAGDKGDAEPVTEHPLHATDKDCATSTPASQQSITASVISRPVEEPQPVQDVSAASDTVVPYASSPTSERPAYTTFDDLPDESHILQSTHATHPTDSDPLAKITSSYSTGIASSSLDQPSSSSSSLVSHEGTLSFNGSQTAQSTRMASIASNLSTSISSSIALAAAQSHSPPPPPPAPPVTTGGESIYRTIMNRLTALEANTTLYARYVEEQTAGIREVLLRLGEDLGRLEGIGKAQSGMYQRSVTEFDKQRRKLEGEQRELLAKVDRLTDEVVLEKRLGILQLCVLLAVLVFMTLTRGSRGEHASAHRVPGSGRPVGMREWGRRTLSISGDWVNSFRSRSPTLKPVTRPESRQTEKREEKVDFPSRTAGTPSHRPFLNSSPRSPTFSHSRSATRHLTSRPRTPSSLRVSTPRYHNLHARSAHATSTPPPSATPSDRPQMTRSTSSSAGFGSGFSSATIGSMPRSAKRWARSAHLHEVKSNNAALRRTPESTPPAPQKALDAVRESDSASSSRTVLVPEGATPAGDVFSPRSESVSTPTVNKGKDKQLRPTLSPLRLSTSSDLPRLCVISDRTSDVEGSEGDAWVDTDADESESESGIVATGITPSPTRHAILPT